MNRNLATSAFVRFKGSTLMPLEWSAPFSLKQTRGFSPYMFTVQVSNETVEAFLPKSQSFPSGAECSFEFFAPKAGGGQSHLVWNNWYLVRSEPPPHFKGSRVLTFADERWALQYRLFDMSYNIQWPDGSYREDTVPGGGGRTGGIWTALDAAVDALKKMGYSPNISRVAESSGIGKRHIPLPNNLGNSPGGGYVGASAEEILSPMLRAIDCDLVFGFDGQPYIVDRAGDPAKDIQKLRDLPRIVDVVEKTENGWEKPRKIRVFFEMKIEAAVEGGIDAFTITGEPVYDEPVNVMPSFDRSDVVPEDWWDAQVGEQDDTRFVEINGEVVRLGYAAFDGDADRQIRWNWFLPLIFPLAVGRNREIIESGEPGRNALLASKKIWVDSQLRRFWRRVYKVKYPTRSTPTVNRARYLTGIRMGRLTPSGDTRERGSVYCDWVDKTSQSYAFSNSDPWSVAFSRNHPFDPLVPAPFTARWLADTGDELLFELVPPEASRIGQAEILPGLFTADLNYGNYAKIVNDEYLELTEAKASFQPDFRFRVMTAGRLIADIDLVGKSSPIGTINSRSLVLEYDAFKDGSIESLDIKNHSITANFGFSSTQLAKSDPITDEWPEVLLNGTDLQRAAVASVATYKRKFDLGMAGGFLMAGLSGAEDGVVTAGDIAEASVVVGNPDPWSITTQYIVLPSTPKPVLEPEERDGKVATIIAEE